jgi:hypothetical protein
MDAHLAQSTQRILRHCAAPVRVRQRALRGLRQRGHHRPLVFGRRSDVLHTLPGAEAERFDRAYRDFFRPTGNRAGGAELVASFHRTDPRSDAILADWFTTAGWYARLSAGQSITGGRGIQAPVRIEVAL